MGNWVDKTLGAADPAPSIPDPIRIDRDAAWVQIEPDLHRFVGTYDPTEPRASEPGEMVLSLSDPSEVAIYWGGIY